MMAVEPHAIVAEKRARKADQIARHLAATGVTAATAAHLDASARRRAEAEAGVKRPGSARTWRNVIEMLAGSMARGALCLTCGTGDPEGVPGPRKPWGHPGPCAR